MLRTCSMIRLWSLLAPGLMMGTGVVRGAPIVIDDFGTPAGGVAVTDTNPLSTAVATGSTSDLTVPGGWRVMQSNLYPGGDPGSAVTCSGNAATSGQFQFTQTPTARGTGYVWWDGNSNELFGDSGFAPLDLTDGGTNAKLSLKRLQFAKHPRLYITVKTVTGTRTYMENLNGPPYFIVSKEIPFTAFGGTGSFTQVIAIQVGFNFTLVENAGKDASFESIQAIP